MKNDSLALFKKAQNIIPGGVNSPVRAFNSVGRNPIYVKEGKGQYIWTVEKQKLLDFCCSWGAIILGHAHKKVIEKVSKALKKGTSFGINTEREVEFAELILSMAPDIEMIRLVNSGTEAVMTAIRLARAFTKRTKIIKFEGCYHGHHDSMLVSAGSGLLTTGIASSDGVPDSFAKETIVLPYNDTEAVADAFKNHADQIAALIVEPIACNMGVVLPEKNFLQNLRKITQQNKAILIFDEVITGFRFAPTTYANLTGIKPDLYTLGKIIGGGFPIGAVAGKKEMMQQLSPLGKVYQAGTLSGNPIAVTAGYSTLKILKEEPPYPYLKEAGSIIKEELTDMAKKYNIPLTCNQFGGVFTPFFTNQPVSNMATAKTANTNIYAHFFRELLNQGYYLPPSQFEAAFVSAAHTKKDIEKFLKAVKRIFKNYKTSNEK